MLLHGQWPLLLTFLECGGVILLLNDIVVHLSIQVVLLKNHIIIWLLLLDRA